jgi:hypothetical protein
MSEQQKSVRKWRVTVIEWLSHVAVIEAHTAEQAEEIAQRLWAENGEHNVFRFSDSDIDGIVVDEV